MKPLLLINPNTNADTTKEMVEIARRTAPFGQVVDGVTARHGAPLIYNDAQLSVSASAVLHLAKTLDLTRYSGLVVAAFGDPGIDALRRISPVPVTGIAEAGIIEAAQNARRFSIVTTTPDLVDAICKRVEIYGYGQAFTGVRLTEGDVIAVMSDPERLEKGLLAACARAICDDKAEAVIIGGGPLAVHAVALGAHFDVPIIEPAPAAIRLAVARTETSMAGMTA